MEGGFEWFITNGRQDNARYLRKYIETHWCPWSGIGTLTWEASAGFIDTDAWKELDFPVVDDEQNYCICLEGGDVVQIGVNEVFLLLLGSFSATHHLLSLDGGCNPARLRLLEKWVDLLQQVVHIMWLENCFKITIWVHIFLFHVVGDYKKFDGVKRLGVWSIEAKNVWWRNQTNRAAGSSKSKMVEGLEGQNIDNLLAHGDEFLTSKVGRILTNITHKQPMNASDTESEEL